MNKPHLIGLLGYAGSGKDAVFRTAKERLPDVRVARFAFADKIKEEVCESLGITQAFLNEHKEYFRTTLQHWGQRARLEDPDYWITHVGKAMAESDAELVFVTDVRYLNEANYIRGAGGVLVRVNRERVGPANDHISERENELIVADWVIDNPGDERLKDEATRLLVELGWMEYLI